MVTMVIRKQKKFKKNENLVDYFELSIVMDII